MAFKFTPKGESELSRGFDNLPDGKYPFTVLESAIAISKSVKNQGKEMVAVKLNVHGQEYDRHVYDYFADWFSEWKLKHFCETTNQARAYVNGAIDPSSNAWRDMTGFVKITTENDNKGKPRNVVVDYCPDDRQKVEQLSAPSKPVVEEQPPEEDDVPF